MGKIIHRIDRKFLEYHRNNPHIYEWIVEYAKKGKTAGMTRYGMKAIFELIRWRGKVLIKSDKPFKLCNTFTALYARIVMKENPDLKGFFITRPLSYDSIFDEPADLEVGD